MQNFLTSIGISFPGELAPTGEYIVTLPDSETFSKVFSKLDKCELLAENMDISTTGKDISNIMYESDEYAVDLIADFDHDVYKLIVDRLDREDENE